MQRSNMNRIFTSLRSTTLCMITFARKLHLKWQKHSLDLIEVVLRGNTGTYVKLALCTDQRRTPDIPIRLRRLGLAMQIDLESRHC